MYSISYRNTNHAGFDTRWGGRINVCQQYTGIGYYTGDGGGIIVSYHLHGGVRLNSWLSLAFMAMY